MRTETAGVASGGWRGPEGPYRTQVRAVCSARLPDGRQCLCPPALDYQTGLPRNGRCAAHGGRSTGPKTPEGRHRSGAGFRTFNETRRRRV